MPLTTIDNLVRELKLPRVDFIRVDIEGAEQPALMGARATLAAFGPRLAIAAYHLSSDPVRIPELVHRARPNAVLSCGFCAVDETKIVPEVLHFR